MSRDIKYIGMDVHKEAVVIAVLNSSGKLVMESIVETKASSILQFIHGFGANCMLPGKKEPGRLGSMTCCSHTCSKCWAAIRGAMPY